MRAYLEHFEGTYRDTVDERIDAEFRNSLFRYPLLKCRLVGYVSTNFGAGYEYFPTPRTSEIETIHGSMPINELILAGAPKGPWRNLYGFGISNGATSHLTDCSFNEVYPFILDDESATAILQDVKVESGRWKREVLYAEIAGDRSADRWSEIEAVGRAKDEVLVALTDQQLLKRHRVDLPTFLSEFKKRTVLLLGDFSSGRQRLDAIQNALRELNYEPVLLDDVPDDFNYDLREKFNAIARVCRFAIFDDSSPSGHLVEMAEARQAEILRIHLREKGSHSSYMAVGQSETSKMVFEVEYELDTLRENIGPAVKWVEKRLDELQERRTGLYPWREEGAGS